jgi:hypothetical protein
MAALPITALAPQLLLALGDGSTTPSGPVPSAPPPSPDGAPLSSSNADTASTSSSLESPMRARRPVSWRAARSPSQLGHLARTDTITECPRCASVGQIYRFAYWKDRKEFIYRCAHELKPKDVLDAEGQMLSTPIICGHTWTPSVPLPHCGTCSADLRIQERGELAIYFACSACHELTHRAREDELR